MNPQPAVAAFFDPATSTFSYVLSDPATGAGAIIDPVLDYQPAAGRISHAGADNLVAHVQRHGLKLEWILETHVHADHLSAAKYLKHVLGGRIGIGERITEVQRSFGRLFNAGADFAADGSQFDHLFADGEIFSLGNLEVQALHTPGHTPACVSYRVSDMVFVGDALFMPDLGTGRCDFPGGDARALYRSIRKLLALPDPTRIFMCHDYKSAERDVFEHESTVAAQRARNIHVHDGIGEADFVHMREARDATLDVPTLILPALQVNMRAGDLPPAEADGTCYLKIPLNRL